MCPECSMPAARCVCRSGKKPARGEGGTVRVGRETKGRKGKGVTVISGLGLPQEELLKLAGELKRRCGSGGTVKDGVIEVQGDHRDLIVEELRKRGHTAKRSGG
ncbi:MAG: stress response translation initiation inhibitor YciH [bacterium]